MKLAEGRIKGTDGRIKAKEDGGQRREKGVEGVNNER